MRPVIEKIDLQESNSSFRYFKLKEQQFKPLWHYHPELELTLITKGSGTRFVGNSILTYSKNDLVLFGSNLPHNYTSHKNDTLEKQEAIVLQFPVHLFDTFKECEPLHTLYKEADRGIQFIEPTQQLLTMLHQFDTFSTTEQVAILLQILQQLNEHKNRNYLSSSTYYHHIVNSKTQRKLKFITSYILDNLDQRLTVKEMAAKTNMVEQSFCRWFKKGVGHSFITFLNSSRIEIACMYLSTTDKPIQAIAFDCGFESVSHFNRTFKKLKGKSPRAFRN